jgi:hypothetical protein
MGGMGGMGGFGGMGGMGGDFGGFKFKKWFIELKFETLRNRDLHKINNLFLIAIIKITISLPLCHFNNG